MDVLLSDECYNEFFTKGHYTHGKCLTQTLSKICGLIVIVMCSILKIPQIMQIVENESGEGLSLVSVTLDLIAEVVYLSYSYLNNFPFTSWGEAIFLVAQTALIGFLVLHYQGESRKAMMYATCSSFFVGVFVSGLVPMVVLSFLQALSIGILVTSKMLQASINYSNKHTGQLSAATVYMLLIGSSLRLFTSIVETGDPLTIVCYIVCTACNSILVGQVLYYREATLARISKKC